METTWSDVKDSTVSYVIHTKKTHTKNITRRSCLCSNFICTLWPFPSLQSIPENDQNLHFFKKTLLTYGNIKQTAQYFSKSTISVVAMAQGDRSCQLQSLHLLYNFEFVGILTSNKSSNPQALTIRVIEACLLPNLGEVHQLWETEEKKWKSAASLHEGTVFRTCI